MLESFHQEHNRRYGYRSPDREIEIVTLRLRAAMPMQNPARIAGGKNQLVRRAEESKLHIAGKFVSAKVYQRESLKKGKTTPVLQSSLNTARLQ